MKEAFVCKGCNDGLDACILITETEAIPHLCPFIEKNANWIRINEMRLDEILEFAKNYDVI